MGTPQFRSECLARRSEEERTSWPLKQENLRLWPFSRRTGGLGVVLQVGVLAFLAGMGVGVGVMIDNLAPSALPYVFVNQHISQKYHRFPLLSPYEETEVEAAVPGTSCDSWIVKRPARSSRLNQMLIESVTLASLAHLIQPRIRRLAGFSSTASPANMSCLSYGTHGGGSVLHLLALWCSTLALSQCPVQQQLSDEPGWPRFEWGFRHMSKVFFPTQPQPGVASNTPYMRGSL